MPHAAWALVIAVLAVGVLHTAVPDHWLPIALISRQRGWSPAQTARAAALAGVGHTLSTLLIALVLWAAGVAFASRFGAGMNLIASLALIGFGAWVALTSLLEIWREDHTHVHEGESTSALGHAHLHRHPGGLEHVHWHAHERTEWHEVAGDVASAPPLHEHEHSTTGRTSLLLVLGSSPMVEGIPAFFAASRFGAGLIAIMAAVFSAATIGTYVALCVAASRGVQRTHVGPFERYGEVISGSFIALLGIVFLFIR